MRSVRALSVALVLTLACVASPGAQQAVPGTVVLGRAVEGVTEVAVAEALVTIRRNAAPYFSASALTDADGHFVFLNVPAGPYDVRASKAGYVFGEFGQRRLLGRGRLLVLADGQRLGDVRVPLWKSASISGIVVDEAGEPVVGITVQAMSVSTNAGHVLLRPDAPRTARTDDRGRYRISGLWAAPWAVLVNASELASLAPHTAEGAPTGFVYPTVCYPSGQVPALSSALGLATGEHRTGIDFKLQPVRAQRVAGRASGGSTGSMTVELTLTGPELGDDLVIARTTTRADGSFEFDPVAPGEYVARVFASSEISGGWAGSFGGEVEGPLLDAAPSGPAWGSVPVSVADAPVSNVTIAVHEPPRLSGELVFHGSAPMPRAASLALLAPSMANGRRGVRARSEVDASLRFRTAPLIPGDYFFRSMPFSPPWYIESVTVNGREAVDRPIALRDRDVTGIVVTLTDQVSELGGTVRTASGGPDLDAAIIVFPVDRSLRTDFGSESPRLRYARVNLEGRYVLRNVPPGEYFAIAVDDALADNWQAAAFLDRVERLATRLTISTASRQNLDLRTAVLR